jgi:hypothetical protein
VYANPTIFQGQLSSEDGSEKKVAQYLPNASSSISVDWDLSTAVKNVILAVLAAIY